MASVLVLVAGLWGLHHVVTGTLADYLDRLTTPTSTPVVLTDTAVPQPTTTAAATTADATAPG